MKLGVIILSKISQSHTHTHAHTVYEILRVLKIIESIKYLWDIQKAVRCQIVRGVDWDRNKL